MKEMDMNSIQEEYKTWEKENNLGKQIPANTYQTDYSNA
mgnify:CR=1 FL=1